jgi:hypothetical protein
VARGGLQGPVVLGEDVGGDLGRARLGVAEDEPLEREALRRRVAPAFVPRGDLEELTRGLLVEPGGEGVVEPDPLGIEGVLRLVALHEELGVDQARGVVAGALELGDVGIDAALHRLLAVLAAGEERQEDVVALGGHPQVALVVVVIGEHQHRALGQAAAGQSLVDAHDDLLGDGDARVDAEEPQRLLAKAAQVHLRDVELAFEGLHEEIGPRVVAGDALVVDQGLVLVVVGQVRVAPGEESVGKPLVAGGLVGLDPGVEEVDGLRGVAVGRQAACLCDGGLVGAGFGGLGLLEARAGDLVDLLLGRRGGGEQRGDRRGQEASGSTRGGVGNVGHRATVGAGGPGGQGVGRGRRLHAGPVRESAVNAAAQDGRRPQPPMRPGCFDEIQRQSRPKAIITTLSHWPRERPAMRCTARSASGRR